jgi:N-ethylmaleimide reductase
MAPMTRGRSHPDGTPSAMNARYYAQRASLALIISEGTQPSEDGQGYLLTPGAYSDKHVDGWRAVTDAVHEAGGRIVVQLMHVGRVAHPDNTTHGRRPVAPSSVAPATAMFTASGMQPIPEPRELSTAEVEGVVGEFRHGARTAIAAGADGVEIHSANGYLLQQFLSSNANRRMIATAGRSKTASGSASRWQRGSRRDRRRTHRHPHLTREHAQRHR